MYQNECLNSTTRSCPCTIPAERNDTHVGLSWEWPNNNKLKMKHPTYYLLTLKLHELNGKPRNMQILLNGSSLSTTLNFNTLWPTHNETAQQTGTNKNIHRYCTSLSAEDCRSNTIVKCEYDEITKACLINPNLYRSVGSYYSNDTVRIKKIWSHSFSVRLLPVYVTEDGREKTSSSSSTLSVNSEEGNNLHGIASGWKTVDECASYNQMLNDTDCNVHLWNCLPCPANVQCGPTVSSTISTTSSGICYFPGFETTPVPLECYYDENGLRTKELTEEQCLSCYIVPPMDGISFYYNQNDDIIIQDFNDFVVGRIDRFSTTTAADHEEETLKQEQQNQYSTAVKELQESGTDNSNSIVPLPYWSDKGARRYYYNHDIKDGTRLTFQAKWWGGVDLHNSMRIHPGYWNSVDDWRAAMKTGILLKTEYSIKTQKRCEEKSEEMNGESTLSENKNNKKNNLTVWLKKGDLLENSDAPDFHIDEDQYICSVSARRNQYIPFEVRQCPSIESCIGGFLGENTHLCSHGQNEDKPLCETCKENYARLGGAASCTYCDEETVNTSLWITISVFICVLLMFMVLLIVYCRKRAKKTSSHDLKKEMMSKDHIRNPISFNSIKIHFRQLTKKNENKNKKHPYKYSWGEERHSAERKLYHEEEMHTMDQFNSGTTMIMKLVTSYAQILVAFGSMSSTKFSSNQSSMNTQMSSFVNLDISSLSFIQCRFNSNFIDRLHQSVFFLFFMSVIIPFVVYWCGKGILIKLSRGNKIGDKINKSKQCERTKHDVQLLYNKCTAFSVSFMLLAYPTASTKIIKFFDCDNDFYSGKSYLRSDYSIECYEHLWRTTLPVCIVYLILIPIGIPITFFVILNVLKCKKLLFLRDDMGHVRHIGSTFPVPNISTSKILGTLYIGFEENSYWYEVWDMMRRILLTSVFTLIYRQEPLLQMISILLIIVCCIIIQGIMQPYTSSAADILGMILQLILFIVIFSNIMMSTDIKHFKKWQTCSFNISVAGLLIGLSFLIWEYTFGDILNEMKIYNRRLPKNVRMNKREFFFYARQKLKSEMENAINKKLKRKPTNKSKSPTKVAPKTLIPEVDLKNWTGAKT